MVVLMLQTEEGDNNLPTTARSGVYRRLKQLVDARYMDEGFNRSNAADELRVLA